MINCSHRAVRYTPQDLLYNWEFVPVTRVTRFTYPTPAFGSHQCVLCIYESVFFLRIPHISEIITVLIFSLPDLFNLA